MLPVPVLLNNKELDLGDTGFSLGDEAVFSDDLLTKPNGQRIGFDGGVCTVVRVDDAAAGSGILHCVVAMSVKGGTITMQGLNTVRNLALSGMEVSAITGGTGRCPAYSAPRRLSARNARRNSLVLPRASERAIGPRPAPVDVGGSRMPLVV